MTILAILGEVADETDHAREIFGDQFDLSETDWLAVLAEEFGEVAKDVTQRNVPPLGMVGSNGPSFMELRAELVQTAAVAARWIAALDLRAYGHRSVGPIPASDSAAAADALVAFYAPAGSPAED